MICPECGYINGDGQDICKKCRHPLFNMATPPRITARFAQIQMAVHNLSYGQMTTGEFEEFLNRTAEFFLEKYQEVKEMDIPIDMTGELKRELEMGLLGIETFISSIDILRKYITKRDIRVLEEGLQTARKASDLVNTALSLNWQNHNVFRESTEEYLQYMRPDYN